LVESDFLSGWLEIGMVAMAATMGALAAYTTNRRADLVLTNYVNLVDHIADEVVSIIPSSDLPDSMTRRDLDQHNTLAFSVSSLTNMKNSSTTGCLLIEWCNWDSLDLVQEDEVGVLVKEYTRKISGEMTRG
jgi:hypothetical protein